MRSIYSLDGAVIAREDNKMEMQILRKWHHKAVISVPS